MRLSATVLQIKEYLHVGVFMRILQQKNGLVLDPLRVQDKLTNIKSRRRKWDKISHTLRSIHCENKIFLSLIFT